jgi:hypothetical protein
MDYSSMILWVAGTSVTGFLVLSGWCYNLNGKLSAVIATSKKVDEIHEALLGTMDKEGWISKARKQQDMCILHKLLKDEISAFREAEK